MLKNVGVVQQINIQYALQFLMFILKMMFNNFKHRSRPFYDRGVCFFVFVKSGGEILENSSIFI